VISLWHKKDKHFIQVFLKVGHAYVTAADEFQTIFHFSYEETAVKMRLAIPAARYARTHTHACARELRNCLWRHTGTVSSSWRRKGKQGQRVTTCSNNTGKSETEGERRLVTSQRQIDPGCDMWRHLPHGRGLTSAMTQTITGSPVKR